MFLPTTKKEMQHLGWETLDVILVTGDAYIDSPFIGAAVIGKVLVDAETSQRSLGPDSTRLQSLLTCQE